MLLALAARERSGEGQHVDVAMSDASLPLLLVGMGREDDLGHLPPLGAWHPKGGVWRCADGGYLCTTDMEPAYWRRFCEAVGRPDFAALQHDFAAHSGIEAELKTLFLTRSRDEWFALLSGAETQAMPVYSPEEALAHPHNLARGRVLQVPLEGQEPVRQLSLPFTLSASAPVEPRAAGPAGADNAAILGELGFDLAALEAAGAFSGERG